MHRRQPPELADRVLLRPRLLKELLRRFDHRVVVLTAPPGFGKTTLLSQALIENSLAPRGVDVWLSCEAADCAAGALAAGLADALGLAGAEGATVDRLADAVLARAPLPVAIVLDDVHEIAAGSSGAGLLGELLDALPANGHLVAAGRGAPPLKLARLEAAGRVGRVAEADLRLTPSELEELADLHGVLVETWDAAGGWPALVSLSLSAGPSGATRYVWEEVLDRLRPEDRHALAALVAIGGADDDLLRSVVGDVDIDQLAATPLVERRGDVLHAHALWGPVVADVLPAAEQQELRRRASVALRQRGELARAAALVCCRRRPTTTTGLCCAT